MGNHNPGANHVKITADKELILAGKLTCVRIKVNVTSQFIHAKDIRNAMSKYKFFCICLVI